jgi:hypothetical protein
MYLVSADCYRVRSSCFLRPTRAVGVGVKVLWLWLRLTMRVEESIKKLSSTRCNG